MTVDQIKPILNCVLNTYEMGHTKLTDEGKRALLQTWSMVFRYDDADIVAKVVWEWIATHSFPPKPADIRKGIREKTMTPPTDLYDIAYRLGKESLKSESVLKERGEKGQADTYVTISYKGKAFDELPDILKAYFKNGDGLQNWYKEQTDIKAKERFINDMVKLQEKLDIQKMNEGIENPYLLVGSID